MAEISLRQYFEQIESIIEQSRYAEAVAHGRHVLEQYPKHVATYRLLGRAMLEARQDEYAIDMFQRVLSVDAEDFIARVGLSEIHEQRGELDAAIWHLERALEVASEHEASVVEEELRHLYGRRDGIAPPRVQLTRGALARLYLKGALLSRAIHEFRALLQEQPQRVDLSVALAEALWRDEQRVKAAEVCQQVLDKFPYSLKANLILGEIWTRGGREEGQAYLRRAEAVDPENQMAQKLFGAASPLPARDVTIVPLEYGAPTGEERPAWMADIEPVSPAGLPPAGREAEALGMAAGWEAQIEIPSWLEAVGAEETEPIRPEPPAALEPVEEMLEAEPPPAPEEAVPEWLAGVREELSGEELEEETIPAPEEQVPEWLAGVREELFEEELGEEAIPTPEDQVPEWLAGIREGLDEEREEITEEAAPEWLAGLGVEPIGEEEEEKEPAERRAEPWAEPTRAEEAPAMPAEEQVPQWMAELGIEPAGVEGAPAAPVEEAPEWAAEPGIEAPLEETAPPIPPTELPADWLDGLREQLSEEAEMPGEPPAPTAEEAPAPAWLEGEEMPSGEEALAWLEQLSAGKEEELQAQAQAEGEARLAEIMGRPQAAEAPPAEEPEEEAAALPTEEAWAPPTEELVAPQPAAAEEEFPTPAWLEEGELPSGEEALAWLEQLTAGKEEELQAQADAETEARMAQIMGRPQAAEAPPVEETEEAIAPPVEKPFGWTGFERPEAPPEPVAAAEEAPTLEDAALVEEELPTPAWLEDEELPSGEEALAWLEQLTAGKEEELQARADAETEARMAEIMGRPQAAEAPPAEVEAEPVAPPIEEALVPPLEAAAPPVEEPFGWTGFGAPEVPPEPVAVAEEAPAPEEPALPEIPEPAYAEEVMPPPEPIAAAEKAPSPEEPALPEIPEPAYAEEVMPPPVPEFPAVEETVPSEEVHWGAVPELQAEPEKAPAPLIEEVPGVVEMEISAPPVEAVAVPEAPVEEAPVVTAPPIPAEPYAAERRYLKDHSRDYEAWLALARALWQDGEREESREAYSRVIRAGKLLESVIDDLEGYVEWKAEAGTQRILGDAYMKDGRLHQALDTYRSALETL